MVSEGCPVSLAGPDSHPCSCALRALPATGGATWPASGPAPVNHRCPGGCPPPHTHTGIWVRPPTKRRLPSAGVLSYVQPVRQVALTPSPCPPCMSPRRTAWGIPNYPNGGLEPGQLGHSMVSLCVARLLLPCEFWSHSGRHIGQAFRVQGFPRPTAPHGLRIPPARQLQPGPAGATFPSPLRRVPWLPVMPSAEPMPPSLATPLGSCQGLLPCAQMD